jgi:predicted PurR-regulated permease PerM
MNHTVKIPFYAKASLLLIGVYVLVSILSALRGIFVPLIFATLIAILLSTVVNFLVRKGLTRFPAVVVVLLTGFVVVAGLFILLASQAGRLMDAMPQLSLKFDELLGEGVTWFSGFFGISEQNIHAKIEETREELTNLTHTAIGITITTTGSLIVTILLLPVYVFMLLIYQPHIIIFIHRLFGARNDSNVSQILTETRAIIKVYLGGLFIQLVIVAILYSAGLLILGIDYAVLLGLGGACLNVVPYLGGLFAATIYMAIALVTHSPIYVVYVLVLYVIVQFIDNNFIVPRIIGAKMKLNAFASLLAIIAGSALWGIPGLFLAIPLTAIAKLILDHIPSLEPWSFLLGTSDAPLPTGKEKVNWRKFAFLPENKKP